MEELECLPKLLQSNAPEYINTKNQFHAKASKKIECYQKLLLLLLIFQDKISMASCNSVASAEAFIVTLCKNNGQRIKEVSKKERKGTRKKLLIICN